jgi:predicted permease
MLANLLQDIRYSLHGFARRPMFAAMVVVTLALAIGVNVAVFTLYDRIMLRDLRVARPAELVNLVSPGPRAGRRVCNNQGSCDATFSYPAFRALEAAGDSYIDLAASWMPSVAISTGERPIRSTAVLVSDAYFHALGVGPALGRVLGEQDFVDAEPSTVVLSFDYWTSAFGADPAVLGKTLVVTGKALEIVGVAPRDFVGTTPGESPAIFAPLTFKWFYEPELDKPINDDPLFSYLYVFGRLQPGVARERAQAQLDAAFRTTLAEAEAAAAASGRAINDVPGFRARALALVPGARGQSEAPTRAQTPLAVFFVATATILLIACVNLANLMFARAAARIGEVAVRASLGAARTRLYALLSTEALLLAVCGAMVSLPVAFGVLRVVAAVRPPGLMVANVDLDWRAVAAAFAIAAFAAVAFALAPIVKLAGSDPVRALHSAGERGLGSKHLGRFRFALATTQLALSMALLVLAALFAQSLANVARVDLGLRTESVATFFVSPSLSGYSTERGAQVLETIEREIAAHPGVIDVSTSLPLLSGNQWGASVVIEGVEAERASDAQVNVNEIGTRFLATLGIPLLRGREFTEADVLGAPSVAIVNESFVRRFGLGADAIGKRLSLDPREPLPIEIVGVAADSAYHDVKASFAPQVILPRRQSRSFGLGATFYIRTALSPEALVAELPRLVARVDSALPVTDARTLDSQVRRNVQTDWLLVTVAGVLAIVATLLATLGLYGVLSYMVAQRSREIGLRMALGAEPIAVRRLVMKQVGWMVVSGVPVGVVAALLVGNVASSVLYGLAPTDARAIISAGIVLTAAVLAASYWPARRASRVDPVTALRGD